MSDAKQKRRGPAAQSRYDASGELAFVARRDNFVMARRNGLRARVYTAREWDQLARGPVPPLPMIEEEQFEAGANNMLVAIRVAASCLGVTSADAAVIAMSAMWVWLDEEFAGDEARIRQAISDVCDGTVRSRVMPVALGSA